MARRALEAARSQRPDRHLRPRRRAGAQAGIDGVEVHGANGYLPGQFLAPNVNQRDDAWGGTAESGRASLLEAVDSAVAAIGADRVSVRLSPGGTFNDIQDPEAPATYAYVAAELAKRGLPTCMSTTPIRASTCRR